MKWQAYPKYKPSGMDWLGNIPAHWQSKRLKYCVSRINEKVDGRESDLPYTGLEHIESWTGRLLPSEETPTSEGQSSRFKPGDVLFGKLRPYLAKVLRATTDGICTGELLVLRPNGVIQDYLSNYMLARGFINSVDSSTYGAKMPRANWEFIGNLPMLLPPEDEQRAIADFLDRETQRIDALIARKERQIELLQEKRATLISHVVTKGLDPNAPMKDSGIEWLGKIPAHWEVLALRRASIRIQTGSTPPTSQDHYYEDGTIPWFGPSSFGVDIVLTKPVKLIAEIAVGDGVARLFKGGSAMVVTIGATIGKVGYIESDASCNQQITVVTFDERRAVGKFAAYQLKRLEPVLRGVAPATTLPIMNQQEVGSLPVALPPIEEQQKMVSQIDAEAQELDVLIDKIHESIAKLHEYRTALISAAVTGKIQVQRTSEVRCT